MPGPTSSYSPCQARQAYLSSEVTSLTSEVEGLKKDAAKFTDRLSQLEEAPLEGVKGVTIVCQKDKDVAMM